MREVDLHKNLKHKHVVEFHSYFEDDENVYIVLENCPRKVMVDLCIIVSLSLIKLSINNILSF